MNWRIKTLNYLSSEIVYFQVIEEAKHKLFDIARWSAMMSLRGPQKKEAEKELNQLQQEMENEWGLGMHHHTEVNIWLSVFAERLALNIDFFWALITYQFLFWFPKH